MIMKRDYTPLPPPPPPVVHSKPNNDAELQWAIKIRKQRLRLIIFGLLFFLLGAFVTVVSPNEEIGAVINFLALGYLFYKTFRLSMTQCPRCNEIYTYKIPWGNPFTSKCLHCGLSTRNEDLEYRSKNGT